MSWEVLEADCVEAMREMDEASIDAIVTDPPYNLHFMSRAWDRVDGEPVDPAFLHWFAGFVDGEGCFSVHKKKIGAVKHVTYDCQFSIALRADDRPILERIQRTLGMGTLSKRTAHQRGGRNGKPQARYAISSQRECLRLRELFRGFPLRAKKAKDFELWSDALDAWVEHEPGQGWDDVAEARNLLMASREYAEEGIRVDPFQMWCWRWAREAYRVLKPGGHLLAMGGTRTSHRLTAGIEDAGFEIRDSLMHLYGSGFPKSLDVSKAIDKAAGADREVLGQSDELLGRKSGIGNAIDGHYTVGGTKAEGYDITAPATPEAAQWEGWGTALKPAHEPIVVARKPLVGTVAYNVQATGGYAIPDGKGGEGGGGKADPRRVCGDCLSWLREDGHEMEVLRGADEDADLFAGVPEQDDEGGTKPAVEGRAMDQPTGLRDSERGRGRESEASAPRTSPGDREGDWAEAQTGRDGASPGREQAEQSPEQPSPNDGGGQAGTLTNARAAGCARCGRALFGTGALNVDGCRVGDEEIAAHGGGQNYDGRKYGGGQGIPAIEAGANPHTGRWPANVVLSHQPECEQVGTRRVRTGTAVKRNGVTSEGVTGWGTAPPGAPDVTHADPDGTEEVAAWRCAPGCPVAALDEQSGERGGGFGVRGGDAKATIYEAGFDFDGREVGYGDSGGASRFFYTAKASRAERNAGLEGFAKKPLRWSSGDQSPGTFQAEGTEKAARNAHPTVKPIALMRWLCRLVTPPGGTILDPFTGSGTTGCAAMLQGFDFIGIEREPEYTAIARARIAWWEQHRGREAEEVLADSRRSEAQREQHEAAGQLGLDFTVPVVRDNGNREGEASAERRYTEKGASNFAMKPGRRRRD